MAYKPNIVNNDNCKKNIATNFHALKNVVDKKRISAALDYDRVAAKFVDIENAVGRLDNNISTGKEDIKNYYDASFDCLKKLKRALNGDSTVQVMAIADKLLDLLEEWSEKIDNPDADDLEEKETDVSRARKEVELQLDEYSSLIGKITSKKNELEANIKIEEAKVSEYEHKIAFEVNERLIDEYVDMCELKKAEIALKGEQSSDLASCISLLDSIVSLARMQIDLVQDKSENFVAIKVLLQKYGSELSNIVENPNGAIRTLNKIKEQIETSLQAHRNAAKSITTSGSNVDAEKHKKNMDYREQLRAKFAAEAAAKSSNGIDLDAIVPGSSTSNSAEGIKTK